MNKEAQQLFNEADLDISEETAERIYEIAKQSSSGLQEVIDKAEEEAPHFDDEDLIIQKLSKFFTTATVGKEFTGITVAFDEPSNIRAGIKQNKRNRYQGRQRKGVQEGHLNEDGQPIWHPEDKVPGNANVGDRIEDSYVRNFYGFAYRSGEDAEDNSPYYFEMTQWGDAENEFEKGENIPVGEPVKFRAMENDEPDHEEVLEVRYTSQTVFQPVDEDFDKKQAYEKLSPKVKVTTVDEARKKLLEDEDFRYNDPVIFEDADINDLNSGNSITYKMSQVGNLHSARLIQLKNYLNADEVGKGSKVHVLGRPWMPNDADEDDDLLIETFDISTIQSQIPDGMETVDNNEEEATEPDTDTEEVKSVMGDTEEDEEDEDKTEEVANASNTESDSEVEGTEQMEKEEKDDSDDDIFS